MASKIVRKIVIMGAPASGKVVIMFFFFKRFQFTKLFYYQGTISERIIKNFNFTHLACGDILRKNIEQKTVLGLEAQTYINKGQLAPDSLVIKCILDQIKDIPNSEKVSLLLDGFPRTINQAKELDAKEKIDAVINLAVPFDVIIDRVKGRWVHLASGRVYNVDFNMPKVPFKDDVTGLYCKYYVYCRAIIFQNGFYLNRRTINSTRR